MRKHFVLLGILGLALGLAGFGQQKSATFADKTSGTAKIVPLKCVTVSAGDGCNRCTVCKDPSTGHYGEMACTLAYCVPPENKANANDAAIERLAAQPLMFGGNSRKHAMGESCSGIDDSVCHLTVSSIRADEKNPHHSAINLSVEKQDSLHISGDSPFTVEFVSDDKGPAPFYRPQGKPAKVFASGPARSEASGHKYHMVIHDQAGSVDPHICISGGGSSC